MGVQDLVWMSVGHFVHMFPFVSRRIIKNIMCLLSDMVVSLDPIGGSERIWCFSSNLLRIEFKTMAHPVHISKSNLY